MCRTARLGRKLSSAVPRVTLAAVFEPPTVFSCTGRHRTARMLTHVDTIGPEATLLAPYHVRVALDDVALTGELIVPPGAPGVIVCLGSRSECVGKTVRENGNATLRIDLLTPAERREDDSTHCLRFNIGLLAKRLAAVTRWLAQQPKTMSMGLGYFGEEMTGAVALAAAAELGPVIDAVVCRNARPDFAANVLPRIDAATLFICSTGNKPLLEITRITLARMHCEKQLQLIPDARNSATPTRDCVGCTLAARWFRSYVRPR